MDAKTRAFLGAYFVLIGLSVVVYHLCGPMVQDAGLALWAALAANWRKVAIGLIVAGAGAALGLVHSRQIDPDKLPPARHRQIDLAPGQGYVYRAHGKKR